MTYWDITLTVLCEEHPLGEALNEAWEDIFEVLLDHGIEMVTGSAVQYEVEEIVVEFEDEDE